MGKLLKSTGGKLEISKCNFALFQWDYDNMGRAILLPNNNQSLSITNSDTKATLSVPQISHSQSYKYVGVQIALDGNMEKQISTLQDK
jgi:hypothetical protein